MNKIIKSQLEKVTSTIIDYDDTSTKIFIPKTIKILTTSLKKGNIYTIELYDTVVNPDLSSVLAANWNRGIIPKHNKYIIEVIDNMAKMVRVNGVAVDDPTDQFFGWLPYDSFEVISIQ